MGTRSMIRFVDNGKIVAAVYQQFDGYLSAVGDELCEFLEGGRMVNGISFQSGGGRVFNGIGCLAAQFIAKHKESAGGLYMHATDCEDEECNYWVIGGIDEKFQPKPLVIKYEMYGKEFEGTVSEFRQQIVEDSQS